MILSKMIRTAFATLSVEDYAWLHFLSYIYPNGMDKKSWFTDQRMNGRKYKDSLDLFIENGFAILDGDVSKATPSGKQKVKDFFLKDQNEIESFSDSLKKYDSQGYKISRIPFDIYDTFETKKWEANKIRTLSIDDYTVIRNWIKSYQRVPESYKTVRTIKKYSGKKNELIGDQTYTLYRGLHFSEDKTNMYFYDKDKIKQSKKFIDERGRFSWTKSKEIAIRFALGNKHWMDDKKTIQKGNYGIVLKHTFNANDVILDFDFIDRVNVALKSVADFPEEREVIVVPQKVYSVETILEHESTEKVANQFQITIEDVEKFSKSWQHDLKSRCEFLLEYSAKDPDAINNVLAAMNEAGQKAINMIGRIHYNEKFLKEKLLEQEELSFESSDYFPLPIYISDGSENSIGVMLYENGKKELFEGNDEASDETYKIVNDLLDVGNNWVKVYGQHGKRIIDLIEKRDELPEGIYVSPRRDVAEGYWHITEEKYLFTCEIQEKYIRKESDQDWKIIEACKFRNFNIL